ncbi:MAG: hypothetical protein IJ324_05175 [Lachnospiraceae bacterium]|nr:hypothetical protein [Lachnospiraceae bacterium]
MEKLWDIYQNKKRIILPVLGLLAVSVIGLIYVLLGERSYVEVHDQMDGEILNYIYQAKYLFQGDVIPEFMNGMDKASMIPPAPLAVLFYKILPPFGAYVAVQWMVVMVGFLGMYFLCGYLGMPREIGLLAGVLFAYMPFYPTYGLAALGQPMLVLCYLQWVKGERKLSGLLGICFYGLMSSLTLVGFVWLILGGLHLLCLLCKRQMQSVFRSFVSLLTLAVTYGLTNLDLIKSVLGEGFTTHREEMVLSPTTDLLGKLKELLLQGGSYSKTYAAPVLVVALFMMSIGMVRKTDGSKLRNKRLSALLLGILGLSVLAVLWNASNVVELRNAMGGVFTYFQADRIYWIFPFLWMLAFALCLEYAVYMAGCYKDYAVKGMLFGIGCVFFLFQGVCILRDSTLNKNIRLLLVDGYSQVTWESLYMEDVFDEIEAVVETDKNSYSVVSLGMYPSVALYNGFICADGYSNNYDLEYKHAFRKIISGELKKNGEVQDYFDDWGNRCYLATGQRGFDAMVQKGNGFVYKKPSFNLKAMEELNIRYIFAAAPVEGAGYEEMLVEGSPFSSENSYYEVWVYDLQKNK